jgi:hypothetical protein
MNTKITHPSKQLSAQSIYMQVLRSDSEINTFLSGAKIV